MHGPGDSALSGVIPKPQAVKTVTIPDGEIDPAVWGKAYPEEFETLEEDRWTRWRTRRSRYKTGMDGGRGDCGQAFRVPLHGPAVQRLGVRRRVQRAPRACLHDSRPARYRCLAHRRRRGLPELQEPLCAGTAERDGGQLLQEALQGSARQNPREEPGTGGRLHRLPRQQGHEPQDLPRLHADRGLTSPWGSTPPS